MGGGTGYGNPGEKGMGNAREARNVHTPVTLPNKTVTVQSQFFLFKLSAGEIVQGKKQNCKISTIFSSKTRVA